MNAPSDIISAPTHITPADKPGIISQWLASLAHIDFALQPIVNPVTGVCYGVEALLRGHEKLGYRTQHEFFDAAFVDEALFLADIALREKAIAKFRQIRFHEKLTLFYNYDPRILEMPDYRPGMTEKLMTNFELDTRQICFEINEQYPIESHTTLAEFVRNMKARGIKIALDDFGSGYAGMELLYHADPGYLKFDRFLISNIQSDTRKKNICSHLVSLCRMHGVMTVAEGVETAAEARTLNSIGFNLIQGYFVQKPTPDPAEISPAYEHIVVFYTPRREELSTDAEIIRREILRLDTIGIEDDVRVLLDKFHDKEDLTFFPVLDKRGYPVGIVHERQLKQYVYSPYGRELLANKSVTPGLANFVTRCPITDIHTPQDKILEIFLANPQSEGVIVVQDGVYFGFLNAKSLLSVIHEKNLAVARDMNPLTRLPGNNVIHAFMRNAINKPDKYCYFIYFDFDNFKPFNDRYGFRQGDRVITLFVNLLKQTAPPQALAGHIGGDDFFLGIEADERGADAILKLAENLQQSFEQEIKPFFTPEERAQRYYISTDRDDAVKKFPILSVSAAIVELTPGQKPEKPEEISELMARLKHDAKRNAAGRAMAHFAAAAR